MLLLSVSTRVPRVLGTICSCFQLFSHSFLSINPSVVHFSALSYSNPNYIPHSTRIPESHLELQQLLSLNKSGYNNVDDALLLFRKMLKMRPLPCDFHFNQLLTALVKMKQCEVGFSIFRDMCTLEIPVDIITFNIAINCCCHSNRLDYAFSLLAAIFKRGLMPTVITYNTLIRGLLAQHKSAEARLLFENLIKFREVQLNVVTFTTMIDGLCKTGHTDMALWLFRFMEKCNCKPNIVTYNTVIDSFCEQGLADDALDLHSEMIENGILPDVWSYNAIIRVLCRLDRWEDVSILLKQMMEDISISPDVHTFTILIDAYSKSGKLDDAKHIIEIMSERGVYPDIVTYNTLMQGYCTQGQTAIAFDLYRKILSEGLSPTIVTHNILVHGLCQMGKSMEALTILYKMQDQGHRPDIVTYETLLGGLCKNRYVDKALSLFQAMECNGLLPDSKTYNIVICGCLCNRRYIEACKLVDKMVNCGFSADGFTQSLLHLLLSEAQDPTVFAIHQKCLH
ncbi:hypothetical protein AgCh_023032 [Apium graveolens]